MTFREVLNQFYEFILLTNEEIDLLLVDKVIFGLAAFNSRLKKELFIIAEWTLGTILAFYEISKEDLCKRNKNSAKQVYIPPSTMKDMIFASQACMNNDMNIFLYLKASFERYSDTEMLNVLDYMRGLRLGMHYALSLKYTLLI